MDVSTIQTRHAPIPICHVQVLPLLSGAQRSMLEIFKHLDPKRYLPHVVCKEPGPLTVELDRLRIGYTTLPTLDRPLHPWRDWRAYRDLLDFFRRRRFELVHTHSSKPGILARVAARHAGVPRVVHHVRGFAFHEYSTTARRIVFSRMEKWAGKYCDRVLFVNHEEHAMSVRRGLLPAEKCQTIYNGTDLREFDPSRREQARKDFQSSHQIAADEVTLLFMGRLDYPKQPQTIPEIAARLEARSPHVPWKIIVAGEGPDEPQLRSKIRRMGLGHRFRLIGWQDDHVQVTLACDVMLMCSLAEGLPRTLIQAHAAGLPTVAGNVKGVREVVTEQTGILCDHQDAEGYAVALSRLIDNASLRRSLGAAARRRAMTHFDSVKNNQQIVQLYDDLLNVPRVEQRPARAA